MRKSKLIVWLDALRSGDYPQTRGALRKEQGFCALGVLCDLSKLDTWEKDLYQTNKYVYLGQINYLPKEVATWAEMSSQEVSNVSYYLMALNDQKRDFSILIDALERKYRLKI